MQDYMKEIQLIVFYEAIGFAGGSSLAALSWSSRYSTCFLDNLLLAKFRFSWDNVQSRDSSDGVTKRELGKEETSINLALAK
ncbi:MAG: hypothetical protein M1470_07540 [Bacteroidetes bacterium]|nr:hypothetical protein [Bacteroidota bacterium]